MFQVAVWNDFTVWRCDRGAEIVLGGALQFHNFVALDNGHAGLEMVKVKGGFGMDNGPGKSNCFSTRDVLGIEWRIISL